MRIISLFAGFIKLSMLSTASANNYQYSRSFSSSYMSNFLFPMQRERLCLFIWICVCVCVCRHNAQFFLWLRSSNDDIPMRPITKADSCTLHIFNCNNTFFLSVSLSHSLTHSLALLRSFVVRVKIRFTVCLFRCLFVNSIFSILLD